MNAASHYLNVRCQRPRTDSHTSWRPHSPLVRPETTSWASSFSSAAFSSALAALRGGRGGVADKSPAG